MKLSPEEKKLDDLAKIDLTVEQRRAWESLRENVTPTFWTETFR